MIRWIYRRLLCRSTTETGYVQHVEGIQEVKLRGQKSVASRPLNLWWADHTEEKTVRGLRSLIARTKGFNPIRFLGVEKVTTVKYTPRWKRR